MIIFTKGILLIVLIISGIGKIIDPIPAIQLLEQLPLVPNVMIIPIISILPVLELAIAGCIIFRYKRFLTYSMNLILFFGFFIISIYATSLKINDDCGCFGGLLESKVGWPMVLRNLIFLGMAIYLFIINNKELLKRTLIARGVNRNA